jgi:3-oxoacyl-[acyl-carrier protein] reductase
MLKFKDSKVLITGATGGIGQKIAEEFAKEGSIICLSATNEEKLQNFSKTLPGEQFILPCNLKNTEEVESLVEKATDLMGGIDILICNAGITKDNIFLRMKNEEFADVIDINLKSSFILSRNAVKKMIKNRFGRIINISSVVGFSGNPGQANYVASKAGLVGMTKSIAIETASRNITANCVAPGFIESPMTDVLNDKQKEAILGKIPVGKMGCADDIAHGVLFLASKDASYITGQTLHINGGMMM